MSNQLESKPRSTEAEPGIESLRAAFGELRYRGSAPVWRPQPAESWWASLGRSRAGQRAAFALGAAAITGIVAVSMVITDSSDGSLDGDRSMDGVQVAAQPVDPPRDLAPFQDLQAESTSAQHSVGAAEGAAPAGAPAANSAEGSPVGSGGQAVRTQPVHTGSERSRSSPTLSMPSGVEEGMESLRDELRSLRDSGSIRRPLLRSIRPHMPRPPSGRLGPAPRRDLAAIDGLGAGIGD